MYYEVICYRNGVETNHSRYYVSLQWAFNWLIENVKADEDANIRMIDDSVTGLKINRAIAHFHGTTQYA